jgi:type IV pilus assembly protein PilY1
MNTFSKLVKATFLLALLSWLTSPAQAAISQQPLFLTNSVPPLVMLTMDRSHKLYYEAYNDAGDLNGDGQIDVGYRPDNVDYYGYFDSHLCYDYDAGSGIFEPKAKTTDKKCSSVAGAWSGDFLNYVTTSRIDALRKVLYGGLRTVDTTSATILSRAFIPQDAHSWGKEYNPASNPGYSISDYTPYSEPKTGRSHVFANTSLAYGGQPLMRVLNDTKYRVWEWVSIERPVAGTKCLNGGSGPNCAETVIADTASSWEIVPSTVLSSLTRTVYDLTVSGGPGSSSHPADNSDFATWKSSYGQTKFCFGYDPNKKISGKTNPNYNPNCSKSSGSMSKLEGTDQNPYDNSAPYTNTNANYMTIVTGTITIPVASTYTFAIDGDDAVEVLIDGSEVAGWYGAHSPCNCTTHTGSKSLSAGAHTIEFRHEKRSLSTGATGSWVLKWKLKETINSVITDYNVNVHVCVKGLEDSNCKAYTDKTNVTTYKPKGLLQDYGENDSMAFGLLTGSYKKNISGGVLRKNVESFKNEVDLETGRFNNVDGIVKTLNSLRVDTFNYACPYCYASGWITTRAINEGEAAEWGNPVAEMMYEVLRYFGGKSAPTPAYSIKKTDTPDANMGLPLPAWRDPYKSVNDGGSGYYSCSKPIQMVISDINPSYDSDQLPGSAFNSFSGDLSGLDVGALADSIWSNESEATNIFIGQSGSTYDNAPTAKKVTSFKSIRGLAPEEPTKMGGYYAASVALFGAHNDLNTAGSGPAYEKDQKTTTFSVALASPLPKIEIPVNGKTVTLVPFAKSVAGSSILADASKFQPTNQIVDFYIESIVNTNVGNIDKLINGGLPYGKFRINYEDVEQAADHDMDAIVEYTFTVSASQQLTISLNSSYAAGGIVQHMGYVISGTTQDGVYLEVRDKDTTTDTDYFLDTPPGQPPGGAWKDSQPLPLTTSRVFTAGLTTSASYIKHDPLWYAAKWGAADKNNNNVLESSEWDDDENGAPDNYFLVTNAGKLSEQLNKAFSKLVEDVSSASAVAANTTRLDIGTLLYQAKFDPRDWSGQLLALEVDVDTGEVNTLTPNWDAAQKLPEPASRKIYTYDTYAAAGSRLVEFKWDNPTIPTVPSLTSLQQAQLNQLNGTFDGYGPDRLNWLRGEASKERRVSGGIFRNRVKSTENGEFIKDGALLLDPSIKTDKLGDIVSSDPIYVAQVDYGYGTSKGGLTSTESSQYTAFRSSTVYKSRTPMVYVGANDGMLHGFDGSFSTGGAEKFAYIPNAIFANLSNLTSPTYQHQYFVDGISVAGDVFFSSSSEWRTLLVGSTGAGGKGVYALDVTDPANIRPGSALWEFTSADATYGANLGYAIPEPVLARMHNGKWAVIVSNGYDSANGSSVLFILDAETGVVIKELNTGYAGANGLSSPTVADYDGDHVADAIYAGDLKGNMWKFDVSASTASGWNVANGKPLFVACAATGSPCNTVYRQPITAQPAIGKVGTSQGTGVMVYFGTGKYFESTDNVVGNNPQVQTFYGLWDDNTATNSIDDRSLLQEQTITFEGTPINTEDQEGTGTVRVTSRNTVCYSTSTTAAADDDPPEIKCNGTNLKKGWAMNLVKPSNVTEGERVVSIPVFFKNLVIFSTVVPSSDPCLGGGKSRIMLLDALTGKRPATAAFDIFGADKTGKATTIKDNLVTASDHVKTEKGKDKTATVASGTDLGIGIHKEISIVGRFGYASGSTGDVGKITLDNPPAAAGGGGGGGKRVSWRQLR